MEKLKKWQAFEKDLTTFFEKELNDEIECLNASLNRKNGTLDIEIWLVCGKGYGDNHYRERNYFVPCNDGYFDRSVEFGKAIDDSFIYNWLELGKTDWCYGEFQHSVLNDCNGWNITVKQELD
jgi:hypothetical protein